MKRVFVYLSALVGLGGAVYLAGNTRAQTPAGGAPAAPPAAAAPASRPTIAVFNMAAVMRDFQTGKYYMAKMSERKNELSKELIVWQAEFAKLREDYEKSVEPTVRDGKMREMVAKKRLMEDKEREINKVLQGEADKVIGELHDKIKMAVDRTAVANGYHVVFSYGEAVTEEEKSRPEMKEVRLRPQPAAFPFYVAGYVDVTKVVVDSLNTWFPAPGPIPNTLPAGPNGGAPAPTANTSPAANIAPAGGVPGKQP